MRLPGADNVAEVGELLDLAFDDDTAAWVLDSRRRAGAATTAPAHLQEALIERSGGGVPPLSVGPLTCAFAPSHPLAVARSAPPHQEFSVRLKFRPVDTVVLRPLHRGRRSTSSSGAELLAEMLAEGADRERRRPPDARGRARGRRDHARDRAAGQQHVRDAVRPRGHLRAGLRPRRRDGHDGRGRRPDPALRGARAARRAVRRRSRSSSAAPRSPPTRCRDCRRCSDLEEYWIEINRLENAGDKNHRRTLANLFSGEFKAIEVLKLKDIVSPSRAPSTRSRRSPTSWSRSRSRSPDRHGARDHHRGRRRRPRLRLHQRLPRRRQRHRHLGVDPGADPADRAGHGRGHELRRRLARPGGRAHRQRRDHATDRQPRAGDRAGRACSARSPGTSSPGTSACPRRPRTP